MQLILIYMEEIMIINYHNIIKRRLNAINFVDPTKMFIKSGP